MNDKLHTFNDQKNGEVFRLCQKSIKMFQNHE